MRLLFLLPMLHQLIYIHAADSGREVPGCARGVGGRERSVGDRESAGPGGSKDAAAAAVVDVFRE